MDVAAGLSSFQNLCNWLKTYREKGFDEALIDASEFAKDVEVEPVFKTQSKRLCKKRQLFNFYYIHIKKIVQSLNIYMSSSPCLLYTSRCV